MEDIAIRIWTNLLGRLGGPLSFRFLIQPAVVMLIAILAGVRDAQAGRTPFFWAIFTEPTHRRERMHAAWSAIWKVFLVAVILDLIYEVLVFKTIFPGETLVVAIVLAVVPYVLVRGPAERIARLWIGSGARTTRGSSEQRRKSSC